MQQDLGDVGWGSLTFLVRREHQDVSAHLEHWSFLDGEC